MSRALRKQDMWPASSFARFLWLAFGLWEDIYSLVDAYKSLSPEDAKLVLARHIIVDFDSLDELLKEFQDHIKQSELKKLNAEDQQKVITAFSTYHRTVQPKRELLKNIRNNLGSHRTGKPWEKAPSSGIMSPNEWGKWEILLTSLEKECDLINWIGVFNAAYELIVFLKDINLDAWYSFQEQGELKFYFPILPSGHYTEG